MSHTGARTRRRPATEALESRRLLAQGVGAEFTIAGGLSDAAEYRTAADAGGRVTVVYQAPGEEGSGEDVFARRFDAAGNPLGAAFRINDATAGDQVSPRVSVDDAGNSVVSWWSGSRIDFRRYGADGTPIGGEAPLAGTEGLSPDYELFGLTSYGFALEADGFQLRFYNLDGTPTASFSFADEAAEEGWTALDSHDPARAARLWWQEAATVTWTTTRAREEGETTVYDAQVWMASLSPQGGLGVRPKLVHEVDGVTEAAAIGMEPRLLQADDRAMIVWREDVDGTPAFRGRSVATWGEPTGPTTTFQYAPSDPDFVEGAATTIAMSRNGLVHVHYLRPEPSGGASSYTRSGLVQVDGRWGPPREDPAQPLAVGTLARVSIQPTVARDFLILWADDAPRPDLRAIRSYSDVDAIGPVASTLKAVEIEGTVLVRLLRSGDLTDPATVPVWTSGGTAIPGYDYESVSVEVTFAPGQAEAEVAIPIHRRQALQGDRTIEISYTSPFGVPYDPDRTDVFTFTIVDDVDPARWDLTFFDYDAAGVWARDESGEWVQISTYNPDQILAASGHSAFLSFGAGGLWLWDADAGWNKLNDVAPRAMALGAGRVFLDYGESGLWSWSDAEGWAKLNDVDPARMVADDQGLYVQFARGGTWSWHPGSGYRFISDHVAEEMVPLLGSVYLDYGAAGLWSWGEAAGWAKLNDVDPMRIYASATTLFLDVEIGLGAHAIWAYAPGASPAVPGAYTLVTTGATGPSAASRSRLYVAVGEGGVFAWAPSQESPHLTWTSPLAIFAGLGSDDALFAFPHDGLMRWDPTAGWSQINDVVPTAVSRA